MRFFSVLIIILYFLTGCGAITGEEVGRLKINQVSIDDTNLIVDQTSLQLKKGDEVAIWSDMDLSYSGDVSLLFRVEILINGENLGLMDIDPMDKNITIGEVKTSILGETDWSFSGKNGEFEAEEDAEYTFKGILVASDNPSLEVKKAEVVFKQ